MFKNFENHPPRFGNLKNSKFPQFSNCLEFPGFRTFSPQNWKFHKFRAPKFLKFLRFCAFFSKCQKFQLVVGLIVLSCKVPLSSRPTPKLNPNVGLDPNLGLGPSNVNSRTNPISSLGHNANSGLGHSLWLHPTSHIIISIVSFLCSPPHLSISLSISLFVSLFFSLCHVPLLLNCPSYSSLSFAFSTSLCLSSSLSPSLPPSLSSSQSSSLSSSLSFLSVLLALSSSLSFSACSSLLVFDFLSIFPLQNHKSLSLSVTPLLSLCFLFLPLSLCLTFSPHMSSSLSL